MSDSVEMIRTEEANELLRSLTDPVTQHLVNHAMHQLIKKFHAGNERSAADFDLLYFVQLMIATMSQHNALKRMLEGELVGALYYDEDLPKE